MNGALLCYRLSEKQLLGFEFRVFSSPITLPSYLTKAKEFIQPKYLPIEMESCLSQGNNTM